MHNLYWLSQITATEKSLVGEKVLLLSQFLQDDFPIVPGFALSSSVFQEFVAGLDDSQSLIGNLAQSSLHLNRNNYQALQAFASKSRDTIIEAAFPNEIETQIFAAAQQLNSPHLILRPSSIVRSDRQQANFGFWKSQVCFCNSDGIVLGIKKIWADLFSAKSLFYWDKLGVSLQQVKLAILIQSIDNAVASGTVELNDGRAIIQATWGLGHSIQRGEVETDRYLVELSTATIMEQKLGFKTHGYHLQNAASTNESYDGLQSYLLEESKQASAVLDSQQIEELTQLINRVILQKPQIRYAEWVLLSHHSDSTRSSFWLTQLNYFKSALDTSLETPKSSTSSLLKGISVSGGRITANVVVHLSSPNPTRPSTDGVILVAKEIQPQDISLLQNVRGIITEIGGQTSHGAILARELGIPALVAATNATKILKTGERVTLDADRGVVYASETLAEAPLIPQTKSERAIVEYYADPATSNVPLATQLMVNLSQVNSIEQVAKLPIDGVGLLRGEFAILELLGVRSLREWLQPNYQAEFVEYLTKTLRQFTQGFAPKPIFYRAIDFSLSEKAENNSVIGVRGTYASLKEPTLFRLELAALKRVMAERQTNLKLILPFVRSLREWKFCRDLVQKVGLNDYPEFQLWMMAEVPSVIFLLPEYIAAGVEGITIGMNDLSQLLLGVDREREFAPQTLTDNILALEKAISQLIQTSRSHHIPCSICLSDRLQNSDIIDKLIRWGIDIISVESQAVTTTYQAIARAEKRLLLQQHFPFD